MNTLKGHERSSEFVDCIQLNNSNGMASVVFKLFIYEFICDFQSDLCIVCRVHWYNSKRMYVLVPEFTVFVCAKIWRFLMFSPKKSGKKDLMRIQLTGMYVSRKPMSG